MSPPREFKTLYGNEARQTTMDNFVSVTKMVYPIVSVMKKNKVFVQPSILKFIKRKK